MTHTPLFALTSSINGPSLNWELQEYMNNLSRFISALKVPPQVNAAAVRGFMNEEEAEDADQAIVHWKLWINTPPALWVLAVGVWIFQVIHEVVLRVFFRSQENSWKGRLFSLTYSHSFNFFRLHFVAYWVLCSVANTYRSLKSIMTEEVVCLTDVCLRWWASTEYRLGPHPAECRLLPCQPYNT